jgi:hypothetical protein
MDKAIDFFRGELSDLERLMQAIETELEQKESGSAQRTTSVFARARRQPPSLISRRLIENSRADDELK